MLKLYIFVMTLLAFTASAEQVNAEEVNPAELYCLAESIYFEARNQSVIGMEAVGHVIKNRVNSREFPNTICGVVHQGPRGGGPITRNRCQFSYYCDGAADVPAAKGNIIEIRAWENAQLMAALILVEKVPDITNGSLYYHANYISWRYAKNFTLVATIGTHLFYRN